MPKSIIFAKGPAISVTLEFAADQLKSASLAFSEKFKCSLVGIADATLRDQLIKFLESYGKKEPVQIELPLDHLTPFRKKVLCRLQQVPFGEVLTYGELAFAAGHPNAARAVGTACHFNPFPIFVPCHRVVASGGKVGGFAYDIDMKKRLLDFES